MESTLQSQGNFLGESRTNFNTVSEILVGRFMTIQSTEEARFIYFVLFPWDPHHSVAMEGEMDHSSSSSSRSEWT